MRQLSIADEDTKPAGIEEGFVLGRNAVDHASQSKRVVWPSPLCAFKGQPGRHRAVDIGELVNSRHSIDVIAREVGFGTRDRMRRAFVRKFGQAPLEIGMTRTLYVQSREERRNCGSSLRQDSHRAKEQLKRKNTARSSLVEIGT